MSCQDCAQCPGHVTSRDTSPKVLVDRACLECGHQLSSHEDGQARSIAAALSPGARISHGEPPADSPLGRLREQLRRRERSSSDG